MNNITHSDMLDSMTVEMSSIKDTILLLSAVLDDKKNLTDERISNTAAALSSIAFHIERIENELDSISTDAAAAELLKIAEA